MDTKIGAIERRRFRERLIGSLLAAGFDSNPTSFARDFNIRANGATVTVHGARKWLFGESFPTQERLNILAKWLNVSPHWLRFGEEPREGKFVGSDSPLLPHDEVILLGDFRRLDDSSRAVVRDLISSLLKHRR